MFVGGGESWGWGNAEKSSFYLASIRANICFSSESNLTSIGDDDDDDDGDDDDGDVDAIEQVDHISKLLFFLQKRHSSLFYQNWSKAIVSTKK